MVRSSLARHLPVEPADDTDLARMRRAAWVKQGVLVLRPEEIADDWLRQAVINLATRLYGSRSAP